MTETARVRANRRNAKRSTGPKTRAGKRRVAANATRHGLAVALGNLGEVDGTVEALAHRIAGSDAGPERLDRARLVAEAQIDLQRVRRARAALIAVPMANANYIFESTVKKTILAQIKRHERRNSVLSWENGLKAGRKVRHRPTDEADRVAAIICDLSTELARLDRYERRALSRRKSAIRSLDASICECGGT